jgi:Zn-dependent protease
VHPFFWLVGVLLGARSSTAVEVLTWVAALLIAILIHELGHALVMRAYGFRPSVILYGLGGLASYGSAANGRSKGESTLGQIAISAAGPGAGFLLSAVIIAAIVLTSHEFACGFGGPWGVWFAFEQVGPPALDDLLRSVLFISLIWGAVNLLPVYPLDGGQIAREVFLKANPRDGIRQSLMLSLVTAAVIAVYGLARLEDWFIALLFGYLAYASYATLQAYSGRRPW